MEITIRVDEQDLKNLLAFVEQRMQEGNNDIEKSFKRIKKTYETKESEEF